MNNEQNQQFESGTGSSTGASAREGQEGVAQKAKRLASDAQHRVGDQVQSQVQTGKTRAAHALNDVANTLLQSAEANDTRADQYIRRAGEQIQRVSDYLQNTDLRDMVVQTENFARRQPALFLGSAFAVGLLAARFVKSSRRAEDERGAGFEARRSDADALYDRERPVASYDETSLGSHGDPLRSGGVAGSGITDSGSVGGFQGLGTAGGLGGAGTAGGAGTTGAGGTRAPGDQGGPTGFADAGRAGTDALSPGSSTGPLGTTEGKPR